MWSPEAGARPSATSRRNLGRILIAGIVAGLPLLAACQVQPLLATPPSGTGVGADLSSIAIKPVDTRYAQEVRNHLIFLFNGGSGQPAAARYGLQLGITELKETTAVREVADENQPSAATVTMIANYVLSDLQAVNKDVPADGMVIATGRRQITAAYDVPLQEFAAVRAERDAENRAARELAELLRLTIAQDLIRTAR